MARGDPGIAVLETSAAYPKPASWHNAFYAKAGKQPDRRKPVCVKGIMARTQASLGDGLPGRDLGACGAGSAEHRTPWPRQRLRAGGGRGIGLTTF